MEGSFVQTLREILGVSGEVMTIQKPCGTPATAYERDRQVTGKVKVQVYRTSLSSSHPGTSGGPGQLCLWATLVHCDPSGVKQLIL